VVKFFNGGHLASDVVGFIEVVDIYVNLTPDPERLLKKSKIKAFFQYI
jgi:hypothetical protein